METLEKLLRDDLIEDEGLRLKTYECTSGKTTIGIGRNLDDVGLYEAEVEKLAFENKERNARLSKKKDLKNLTTLQLSQELFEDIEEYGITQSEAFYLFGNDINLTLAELFKAFPWMKERSINIQRIFANMLFNVGLPKLLTFEKTINLVKEKKYQEASIEMLNSKWAKQVKKRAVRLSNLMKQG